MKPIMQLEGIFCGLLCSLASAQGQAVHVTLQADPIPLFIGQTTHVHVLAQIDPAYTNQSEQIFSWYVDLLLYDTGMVLRAEYDNLTMIASDNDPRTSSAGTEDGTHRRGIFNTFMSRPGAGRFAPVELLSVPVTALSTGLVTFAVQAGSTVPNLTHDFIVATTNLGVLFSGGNYDAAQVDLVVREAPTVAITLVGAQVRLDFPLWPGRDHYLEYQDNLDPNAPWIPLPNGPHNTGQVYDPLVPQRFYRLRIDP